VLTSPGRDRAGGPFRSTQTRVGHTPPHPTALLAPSSRSGAHPSRRMARGSHVVRARSRVASLPVRFSRPLSGRPRTARQRAPTWNVWFTSRSQQHWQYQRSHPLSQSQHDNGT
jgi:hypothetical protein